MDPKRAYYLVDNTILKPLYCLHIYRTTLERFRFNAVNIFFLGEMPLSQSKWIENVIILFSKQ